MLRCELKDETFNLRNFEELVRKFLDIEDDLKDFLARVNIKSIHG